MNRTRLLNLLIIAAMLLSTAGFSLPASYAKALPDRRQPSSETTVSLRGLTRALPQTDSWVSVDPTASNAPYIGGAGAKHAARIAAPADGKIEAQLLDLFAVKGTSDFMVRFAEQADLSPAYSMDWDARGEFVVNTLTTTAERSQAQAKTYLDSRGLTYRTFIAGNDLYVYAGDQATAELLSVRPEVSFIRAPRTYYIDPIITSEPAVPQGPDALAWGIVDVKADQFWSTFGVQGDGIVVANIDTGVQYNHPGLDQAFKCATPTDPACWYDPSNICGAAGACDNNGHGTHTMGTMVADNDPSLTWQAGMAPNAQWIACKGCETALCSDTALNACADWILQPGGNTANRPHVVNNSWSSNGGNTWYLAKVQAWRAAGIFPAFTAGNSTGCGNLGSPGDYQESFGTTGHDSGRTHYYAQGPSGFGHDPYTKPNISGPAVNICSTLPTNNWSCGYSSASVASPHTAGAVALLWSCNPTLIGRIDVTFQALQNNADAPDPANPTCGVPPDGEGTYEDGYGYLNIYQAGLNYCCSLEPGDQHLDMGRQYRLDFHQPDGATFTYTQTLAALQQQQSLSQFAEAESWYRRALLCDPTNEVALSRLADTRWEVATAHLLGGNDWMVQALDVKLSNPGNPLLEEIGQLDDAIGEFALATQSYTSLLTSEFYTGFMALQPTRVDPLTGELTPYLDIQRLALASAEKSRAYVEKAERQFRLFTTDDLANAMQTLRQGMSAAVSEAVLLRTLWDDIAADASYPAILRNIADMQRIFRYLQTGKNPFGYEADYVPIRFLPSHLPDNNFEQTYDLAYQEWTVARDMVEYAQGIQQQIENNYVLLQQNLQSTIASHNTQLLQLCGPNASGQPDFENCHQNAAGEIYGHLLRIEAALLRIELVEQQMDNQLALIDIEQQRAARVAGIQRGTAEMFLANGEKLANLASEQARLRQRKERRTGMINTIKSFFGGKREGGYAIEGSSVEFWGMVAGMVLNGLSSAASNGLFWNYDEGDIPAKRERLIAQQNAFVHYAEAEITDANSEALIKQYMLRFTEYDIELSLATNNLQQELTRLNGLKAQAEYLASEKDKAVAFNLLLFQDPAQRVMREYYMELANARFDVALRYAWIAGRALEYEINQHVLFTGSPLTDLGSLYRVRDVGTLEAALAQMNTAYNDFLGRDDVPAPQPRLDNIYLSEALGFEDTWDPDLGRWVTREEKFNAFVRDRAHWIDLNGDGVKESLRFTFQTSIFLGNLFFPTSVFNDKIMSIKMRIWGNGLGDEMAVIHLKQEGASFIRTVDAFSTMDPYGHPIDEVFEYNISPLKASIMAATNLNELPDPVATNYELASRSVACTNWTLTLDKVNEPNNFDVNIDNLEEIELNVTHETYTLQHLLGAQQEASGGQPQLDLGLFEPPPNRPYQPVLPIIRLFWSLFHLSR